MSFHAFAYFIALYYIHTYITMTMILGDIASFSLQEEKIKVLKMVLLTKVKLIESCRNNDGQRYQLCVSEYILNNCRPSDIPAVHKC